MRNRRDTAVEVVRKALRETLGTKQTKEQKEKQVNFL
jgi:Arc/MetJ-type ribon-helix-helix transcriptional regulator